MTRAVQLSSTMKVDNRVNDNAVDPPTNAPNNANTGLVTERVMTGGDQGDTLDMTLFI